VALDAYGNLFIADEYNHRVRKVSTTGIMTTIAGIGPCYSADGNYIGDGYPATEAGLSYPEGLAFDSSGNLFIADSGNDVIRRVGTNGIISTVAGNNLYDFAGDGEAATNASLANPNLFIAEEENNRVREVLTIGVIITVAGDVANSGSPGGYTGDYVLAITTSLYYPHSVAADGLGNLFMADQYNNRIRKIATNGIITTVAGNGSGNYTGDGGRAIFASLYYPFSVAVDSSGNLLIADFYNNVIRKVDASGVITTAAGDGPCCGSLGAFAGDGGAATNASLNAPFGVAFDASGDCLIAMR